MEELNVLTSAVTENAELALKAFENNDLDTAFDIEPLEEIINKLKARLRVNHKLRLQKGACSIETGFVWADLLTNLERVSDHCSNIADCIIETSHNNLNLHENLHTMKTESEAFKNKYEAYAKKYILPIE